MIVFHLEAKNGTEIEENSIKHATNKRLRFRTAFFAVFGAPGPQMRSNIGVFCHQKDHFPEIFPPFQKSTGSFVLSHWENKNTQNDSSGVKKKIAGLYFYPGGHTQLSLPFDVWRFTFDVWRLAFDV